MFSIELYKFNKKENSTARPTTPFKSFDNCCLKDATSILNPVIHFRPTDDEFYIPGTGLDIFTANYAYIPLFNRYYFINNWEFNSGLWVAYMSCDVLATYKTEIGNSTQYVLRNANSYNESVTDLMYPGRCGCDVQSAVMENPFSPVFSGGTYVLGVVNSDNGGGVGSVSYYILTPAQFNTFRNKLLGSVEIFHDGISEISESLTKAMFNPFQYVASCMWFPFAIGGTSLTRIPLGWWNIDVSCSRLPASGVQTFSGTVAKPVHPQSSGKAFLNDAPYASYRFDWPCVGCISIDPKYLYGVPSFGYICQIDLVTGRATIELKAHNADLTVERTITIVTAQIGVPVQLSQISADYASGVVGIAQGNIGGLANVGGAILSSIFGGNHISSIGNAIESTFANVQSSGTNGSASAFFLPPTLQAKFVRVVDDFPQTIGRPLCEPRKLSTLTGFTMCQNATIEIFGTDSEKATVRNFLNGGFYYE